MGVSDEMHETNEEDDSGVIPCLEENKKYNFHQHTNYGEKREKAFLREEASPQVI